MVIKQTLIHQEAARWQMTGNVNVLFKHTNYDLVSIDLEDNILTMHAQGGYIRLPNSHSLATTHAINTLKHTNLDAIGYLNDANHRNHHRSPTISYFYKP